jgi:GNAT superfamily N-acetyltransferase
MEQMKIKLRRPDLSRRKDILAVANMHFELYREIQGEFIMPTSLRDIYDEFAMYSQIDGKKPQIVVAEICSGVVGSAMYSFREECSSVESIFVSRFFRGRGVGERVIEAILKELKQRGAREVSVASSSKARGFYERFGFERKYEDESRRGMVLALNR